MNDAVIESAREIEYKKRFECYKLLDELFENGLNQKKQWLKSELTMLDLLDMLRPHLREDQLADFLYRLSVYDSQKKIEMYI